MIVALCVSASCYLALTPYVLKIRKIQSKPKSPDGIVPVNRGAQFVPDEP